MNYMDDNGNIISLSEKLLQLKSKGYDQIRIPGGTNKDRSFYAGGFFLDFNREENKLYCMGIPYDSDFYSLQNPKKGHTKKIGETPEEVFVRESFEESGWLATKCKEILPEYRCKDDTNPNKAHYKHYFVAIEKTGTLHCLGRPNPIDEETGDPILFPCSEIKTIIPVPHLWGRFVKALNITLDCHGADKDMYLEISYLLMSMRR